MSPPIYKEFNATDYTTLRKSLTVRREDRSDRQRNFLQHVRSTEAFLEFMEQRVGICGEDEVELPTEKMSEAEFREPPPDTEKMLFETWSDLKPKITCRTPFWGYLTWRHIRENRIDSSFLAADGGPSPSGVRRIDKVLAASGNDGDARVDRCTRTVLRRLGGLPEARGNKSIYVNCPLSRSWWRERLIREVAGNNPQIALQAGLVLRISQEYWEQLVVFVVSRNSVFGSRNIRNALVRIVGQQLADDPKSPARKPEHFLRPTCRTLSTVQASRELSILPQTDIDATVNDVVSMHIDAAATHLPEE